MSSDTKPGEMVDILIVEDSPTQAEQLKYLLEQHHYKVTAANSGLQALALVGQGKPTLVITDIVMPEMDGYELCQRLKADESTQDIPVMLLTGLSNPEDVLEGLACGADSFITKPYSEEYLLLRVEQILANRRLWQNERVHVGLEILFAGKRRFITANQQQMLTLLLSTYEEAVHRNTELVQAQDELRALNERLEELVEARTAALSVEIAERKQAEAHIMHLNEVLGAVRSVNQLIVREKDRERLIQGACDSLIEARGFLSAWIALVDQAAGTATAAQAGLGEAFTPVVEALERGEFPPCGQRVLQQAGVLVLDVSPDTCPGCPLVASYSSPTALATRLEHGGKVYGLLAVSFPAGLSVDEQERELLAEVAGDLAFALHSIEQEEARQQAEAETRELAEALRTSEERLVMAVQASRTGLWNWDIANNTLYWSPELKALLGYADDELQVDFEVFAAMLHPEDSPGTNGALDAHLKARAPYEVEQRLRTKAGEYRWFLARGQAVWDAEGRAVRMAGSTTDITERRQAAEALQRRASQLALINEIGSQVTAFLDLDQVLNRAAQLIQERFGFHHVGLFTRAAGEDRLLMKARAGEFASLFPPDHSVALGQGMVGWVGLHGEALLANDVDAEPRYVNPYPDRLPTRSELSVPIRIGGEIVGVLDVQSPQPNAFTPDDVMTKETLAGQIAVAIHNARLYSQAAQRNRELTLLNRVIAATAAAAEGALEPVLEAVCRELALAFQVPQAAAALFNEEKTEAVVVAEYLAPGRPSALGATIPAAGNPASQHLLTHKTPLVIEDAQTDPRQAPIHDLLRRRGTVSLLLLPLVRDGEVVGSVGVDAIEPRAFSAEEVNLAWRVAEQVSGALARARLEEQRQKLEEQFLQAQKLEAVGRLAGGIAHDFNNLLTVIHLSTRLLERKLRPEDPLWPHVQRIQGAGQRAADLTKQLLAFSRREIVEPKVLDLNQVLADLDDMLRRIIGEDVELCTIPAEGLWPVKIDPSQMDQVILNLAVNARDAMPTGGNLTIEMDNVVLDEAYTARHLGVEPGEYVLLAVSDTGVGMNEEVKAHLFEPFFTTKEKGKGTGLGLATVHGIVKQNNGHTWVYSEPGQGTTFKIYLPHAVEDTRAPSRLPPQEIAPSARGAETLLLVEDEDQVRELTRDILTAQGYQVLTANDGVKALQVAQEHDGPIHLLLSDVVMPRMGGRALADQLRFSRPEMRVLYTSGYTDNAIVHHGVLAEGTHFLSKPFDMETLAQKVRSVLDGTA